MFLSKNSLIKFPFEVSFGFFVPAHQKVEEMHRGRVCTGDRKALSENPNKTKLCQLYRNDTSKTFIAIDESFQDHI